MMPALPTAMAIQPMGNPPPHSHVSAGITDSPVYLPLSRLDPNTQQGHLQDIHHCLLTSFCSLKSEREKKKNIELSQLNPLPLVSLVAWGAAWTLAVTPEKTTAVKSHPTTRLGSPPWFNSTDSSKAQPRCLPTLF